MLSLEDDTPGNVPTPFAYAGERTPDQSSEVTVW